ncbi:phosphotransferase [Microbacterium sp. YY-01]|uniref:phosphotransferase n=1 Tax=Microbacterium sp. YY-01 TaxID=3421634 RepID=UPI003D1651D3
MARSPFTLAAAVTAAVPGTEVTGARALTSHSDGRFDSAVVTLADGSEAVIRVATDDETAAELASESLALRALTAGARSMLPLQIPEFLGEALVGTDRCIVVSLIDGFQVDAADIPPGRGAAESAGAALAAVHTLPPSVVRSAGLPERNPSEVRKAVADLIDRAAATGHVSARLIVRWREAVERDDLWQFESTVTLGGAQAHTFVYRDDAEAGPQVQGLVGWHGLSIGDPAVDLAWLSTAPEAADDVHAAYAAAALRTPDAALATRARLAAELDFARWLIHGVETRKQEVIDDAAQLLDSLADGVRDDELIPRAVRSSSVDDALDALDRVPATPTPMVDTSMQTDAYDPGDLMLTPSTHTQPLDDSDTAAVPHSPSDTGPVAEQSDADESEESAADADTHTGADNIGADDADNPDAAEAQRAARAAIQRWTNSSSE